MVVGKAPFDLEWKMPSLMEAAMLRMERRREEIARREKKRARRRELGHKATNDLDFSRKTFTQNTELEETEPWLPEERETECEEITPKEFYRLLEAETVLELVPELSVAEKRKTFS